MAVHGLSRGQVARAASNVMQVERVPAPLQGMDNRIALTVEAPYNCSYTYNLMPGEYGMEVRKGYREWQIGLEDTASEGVRTLIPYEGVPNDGTDDRLFAVTNEGIWDVTVANGSPVLALSFADDSLDAGYGPHITYVDDSGDPYVFYADQRNGLFVYDPSTDTWAQASGISNVTITNVVFIVQHKERLWLFERDSTEARYLAVGGTSGSTTPFYFSALFAHGGSLAGMFDWSIDGGDGVDDFFVVVSRGGDVLVYQGTDPSSASTWEARGVYYIGALPAGPFFATGRAGELYLLSSQGIVSMSDVLRGVSSTENTIDTIGAKVAYIIRLAFQELGTRSGWQIKHIPSLGAMIVKLPLTASGHDIQFVYNFSVQAWGIWRGLPMTCLDSWKSNVVFGDANSRVLYMDRTRDNVALNRPPEDPQGDPVKFSILTGFSSYGSAGVYKRVKLARPDFLSIAPPTVNIQPRYDFNIGEASAPILNVGQAFAVWDVALWDHGIWAPSLERGVNYVRGTSGLGRYVAIAMTGHCYELTRFVGWDVMYDTGGMMV